MHHARQGVEYDAIVIGSGTSGATIARELARQKKKVLILERGGREPLQETLRGIVAIADQVRLGDARLSTVRAITTGGSTSLYFGVVNYPQAQTFQALGIDLSPDLEAVRRELPIAQVPDECLGAQARALRDSATALGHDWRKNDMFIDLSKCAGGYAYEAKWKARGYVDDAVRAGATLASRAAVKKIIVEGGTAVGVEYRLKTGFARSEVKRAFGSRIVLAAGELATPQMLRDAGVPGVGDRGFFCNPGYAVYGLVPGLKGTSGFVGSMGCVLEDGIELGDANVPEPLHRPMMLGGLNFRHLFAFPECVGIGVKVKDGLGGELRRNGRFHKTFDSEDQLKLSRGRQEAVRILRQAGARHIVDFGVTSAGRVGGLVRIGEHVDRRLETPVRRLHVCDGSVIPDDMRGTPTLTLVSMARYAARQLLSSL
jgi:hypothetical protein